MNAIRPVVLFVFLQFMPSEGEKLCIQVLWGTLQPVSYLSMLRGRGAWKYTHSGTRISQFKSQLCPLSPVGKLFRITSVSPSEGELRWQCGAISTVPGLLYVLSSSGHDYPSSIWVESFHLGVFTLFFLSFFFEIKVPFIWFHVKHLFCAPLWVYRNAPTNAVPVLMGLLLQWRLQASNKELQEGWVKWRINSVWGE